jgi:hypothetical protein
MPIDRSAIDLQLREIGEGDRWWEHREFRDLPHILHADEAIVGIIAGKLLGARRPRLRSGRDWILVATTQRLICLKQERFARKQIEFAVGQIIRVQQSAGLRAYQITLDTAQARYRLRIPKTDAFRFARSLAHLMPNVHLVAAANPQLAPGDAEPRSWLPGLSRMAALPGIGGIAAKLSPPDESPDRVARLESAVERLVVDVERLQQHVAFLEELLQKRADETLYARAPAGS